MTVLGDTAYWAGRFKSVEERLLERIAAVWPACVALLPGQPDEDAITVNLVDLLWRDAVARRLCHWVEFQFEPFGMKASGAKFSKGKVDIGVLLDQDRDRYLAYECKRLNVTWGGTRHSLATEYVQDGLMRFLTEQYSEGLPVGCMLGYVLDGDTTFAAKQVTGAIKGHGPIGLVGTVEDLATLAGVPRFRTGHARARGGHIEVRHALLAYPATASSQRQARPHRPQRPLRLGVSEERR